ncbi:MAG: RNA polymerase sigma-70 factor [Bacteroidota bacterium]
MDIKLLKDNELVDLWIDGDERAYQELFKRYFKKLHYYALKIVPDKDVAEEIVLDVMLCIWQKKHLIDNNLPLSAYLFRSVKNKLIDFLRKRTLNTISIDENPIQFKSGLEADQGLLYKELELKYIRSVEKLPPQKMLIFKMSRNEGLTYQEIAMQLNLSKSTVENHMVAALKTLKRFISPYN